MHKLIRLSKSILFGIATLPILLVTPSIANASGYSNPTGVNLYTAPEGGGVCRIIITWDNVGADAYKFYAGSTLVYGGAQPSYPGSYNFEVNGQWGVGFDFGPGQYYGAIPSSVALYSYYNSLWPTNQGNYSTGVTLPVDQSCPNTLPGGKTVIGAISISSNPIQINNAVTASADFTATNSQDTHIALWNWGDSTASTGTVAESGGSGSVAGTHVYTTAGIYTITLTLTDNNGVSTTQTYQNMSAYNATPQGLFTGAHIYDSPAGAYPAIPDLAGRVNFGVMTKYDANGNPMGSVNISFPSANMNFTSTGISALVTSNGLATLRGSGTINGAEGYTYLATGIDSQQTGGGVIRFQIKDSVGNIVYDSQPGAADTAAPIAPVKGQINVH